MDAEYLEEVIRGVVHQHDESSSTDVVDTIGEADEDDGGHMVDNLFLEVLERGRRRMRRSMNILDRENRRRHTPGKERSWTRSHFTFNLGKRCRTLMALMQIIIFLHSNLDQCLNVGRLFSSYEHAMNTNASSFLYFLH